MVINGQRLLAVSPIVNMFPTKQVGNGVSHGLSYAGYDIRLKQTVSFYPGARKTISVGDHDTKLTSYSTGNFVLASAMEEFQMPSDLVGIVHDKSTWARKGLSVFNTVIEPGWNGFLTLELVYHGLETLIIPAGSGIAQVVFHQTVEEAQYEGKYQDQEDRPVDSRSS